MQITQTQARRFLLAHQGLWPPRRLNGKTGILEYIHRVGCIQFDPLDIAGQNAALVLQARLADFRPELLDQLLYEDRRLLDGWDKNMSIYSLEDWPYFRRRREEALRTPGRSPEPVRAALPHIRQALQERGPLSSLDLDFNQTIDWYWAPTRLSRAALESMYFWGELIIHHKVRTRKVYDLAHRHLPPTLLDAPEPNPGEEDYHDWYVLRRIGGIGLLWNKAGDAWLGMSAIKSAARSAAINRLLATGRIRQVEIEGLPVPFYFRSQDEAALQAVLADGSQPPQASIIAPLDNLMWDRRLIRQLFDFEYRWEVYKPAAERDHGYYVLPILYGDRFVARFEPGRDRKNRALLIKQWWWEPGVEQTPELLAALNACFRHFSAYLGVERLVPGERVALDWLNTQNSPQKG